MSLQSKRSDSYFPKIKNYHLKNGTTFKMSRKFIHAFE